MARQEKVRYAGFWVRLFAAALDFLIISVPAMILVGVSVGLDWLYSESVSLWGMVWQLVKADFYYHLLVFVVVVYLWVNWEGRTPGKKLLGIRIVKYPDYGPLTYRNAVLRFLIGYPVSALLFGLGFLMIGFREDKRGLHDLIAGTCVIYE